MKQILKGILQIFQEKWDVSGTLGMISIKTLVKFQLFTITWNPPQGHPALGLAQGHSIVIKLAHKDSCVVV